MISSIPSLLILIMFILQMRRKTMKFIFPIAIIIGLGLFVLSYTHADLLWFYVYHIAVYLLCYGVGYANRNNIGMFLLQTMLLLLLGYIKISIESLYFVSLLYLIMWIMYVNVQKTYEESSNSYQNKLLKKQIEEVHNIYLIMRGWRHDYHNHLQSLKAKVKLNQMEEVKLYLNELEEDLDSIHQLVESGNVNADAILNSKLSLALKQGIDVNVKARVPSVLQVSDIDLCVLLGNLVDNAIEACEKVEEDKFLRLYIGLFKKQLYISVTNATSETIRKMDDEYITQKRGNHGHGLKRINRIVEKYEGYINRQNEPGVFVCEVMLPL